MRWCLLFLLGCVSSLALCQGQYIEKHDVVYTQGGGTPQLLDYYQPIADRSRPAIVFVHGGGWTGGSKEDFADWGRYYASFGYFCISINYRLTPQFAWPAQIDDTQAAVRWLRKNARQMGVNPNRIGAVGASAGGHLVLMLGTTDTLNDVDPNLHGFSSKVKAVADYYGPSDLTNPREWRSDIWQLITWLVGVPWTFGNPAYQAVSPLSYVSPDDAAMLVFHGDADVIVPVSQSRRIVNAFIANGVPVQYFEFPGEGHGFTGGPATTSILALNNFFATRL